MSRRIEREDGDETSLPLPSHRTKHVDAFVLETIAARLLGNGDGLVGEGLANGTGSTRVFSPVRSFTIVSFAFPPARRYKRLRRYSPTALLHALLQKDNRGHLVSGSLPLCRRGRHANEARAALLRPVALADYYPGCDHCRADDDDARRGGDDTPEKRNWHGAIFLSLGGWRRVRCASLKQATR